jgi:RimJ/RimL family protein N-acetyltransferase
MDESNKLYGLHNNQSDKLTGSVGSCEQRYFYPLSKEDLSYIKDWRNSQIDILRQWRPLTDWNQENWYRIASEDDHQVLFSIKEYKNDALNNLIGYCGITNIDYINRRGEISFLVNPSRVDNIDLYRLDFFAALNFLCRYGFDELNLHKLFTETFDFRRDHLRVLEEFGMHKDGIIREHQFTNGSYHNSIIHSLLQKEWDQIRRV